MKKILLFSIFLLAYLNFCPLVAYASEQEQEGTEEAVEFICDDFKYRVLSEANQTVELLGSVETYTEETLTIPEYAEFNGIRYTVIKIGDRAFRSSYSVSNNFRYIKMPNTIEEIGAWAFLDSRSLIDIQFSENLKEIGDAAFSNCQSLTSLNLPDNVSFLGEFCFDYCTSLTEVRMPDSVTSLSYSSFGNCKALEKVTLSNNIDAIPEKCFWWCTSLSEVRIPDSIKYIGEFAFYACPLNSVYIPASVEFIGGFNFSTTDTIVVDEANPCFSVEDGLLFNKDKTTLIVYPNMPEVATVPEGVETINKAALISVKEKIILPRSLKYVGPNVVNENSEFTVVCWADIPPVLDERSYLFYRPFYTADADWTIHSDFYVPAEALPLYLETAPWSSAKKYVHSIPEEEAGISLPSVVEAETYTVYSMDGRHVLTTTDSSLLSSLPKGLYIINGKKVVL